MASPLSVILTIFLFFSFIQCETSKISEQNKPIIGNKMDTLKTNYERKYDFKTGLEIYDFETVKNSTISPVVVKTKDRWTILIYSIQTGGGFYNEYPPAPEFYFIQKLFYPNGMLKQKSCFFQNRLKIGIWEYYDEKGNLIKKVNEDEKFKQSKITLKDILNLLEKEGWINLKTGEGSTEIISNKAHVEIKPGVNIMFTIENNDKVTWYANIRTLNDTLDISYEIDGITGKVEKKEVPIVGVE